MAKSFGNIGEVCELSKCDLLTISPTLLKELEETKGTLSRKLSEEESKSMDIEKISIDKKTFRWIMNEDAMATEKLSEDI